MLSHFQRQVTMPLTIEKAEAIMPLESRADATTELCLVDTPKQHTIEQVCQFFNISPQQCLKTLNRKR